MPNSNFHLDKWYLDFIDENGDCMIFYSAKLTWRMISVTYASHIDYSDDQVKVRSFFRNNDLPHKNGNLITLSNKKLNVTGTWESRATPINARIFESGKGYLDWKCYQPASKVNLKINGKNIAGKGYAEQLILTAPPWKIPMKNLKWGRFSNKNTVMVWIELLEREKKQWIWLNGESLNSCNIDDRSIITEDNGLQLKLNRVGEIESGKKIYTVVKDLIQFLPGFGKVIPLNFLMADNYKWLSKAELYRDGKPSESGYAIHENVNFNPKVN